MIPQWLDPTSVLDSPVLAGGLVGVGALIGLWVRAYRAARALAVGQVTLILAGRWLL